MDFGNLDYLNPFFLLDNIRPKYFKPRVRAKNIAEIDVRELSAMGVQAFIFDVDNTLCRHYGTGVDPRVREAFSGITEKHPSCILSNAVGERREKLGEYFKLRIITPAVKKPKARAFEDALAYLGARPGEAAVVGDRIMTDIVGANKAGCVSIKVEPLAPGSEPVHLRVSRVFENMLSSLYNMLGV